MQGWHGTRGNAAAKTITHHQVDAGTQPLDIRREIGKIVAVVGVTHDDELALRGLHASHQRGAITGRRRMDNARPGACRHLNRSVGGSIVCHQHFPMNTRPANVVERGKHTAAYRFLLVEARHENSQLKGELRHLMSLHVTA